MVFFNHEVVNVFLEHDVKWCLDILEHGVKEMF